MLIAEKISKSYGNLTVLKSINLRIEEGEIASIVGPSGAGKSTLLHILGTLDKPDSGKIIIDNIEITKLNEKQLAKFRNETLGFVFQFHNLLPEFTALENVCLPAMLNNKSFKDSEKKAHELLSILGLNERKNHKPDALSGGEQQRVAVARALINSPKIIFADEPSGNLDSRNAQELHQLFFTLRKEFNQTFIIVTHNDELANSTDKKIRIEDGVLVE